MDDTIAALATLDGWHAEGEAARVHYSGGDDQYAIEYYTRTDRVVYWAVPDDGTTAAPVSRASVPTPLRERIRQDLDAADVDPDAERREL